jgi:ApaG protein
MSKTTAITKDVSVSVEVQFQQKHSNIKLSKYVFSYNITIKNLGKSTIQLLRRHWIIFESNGTKREMKGEGVIGEFPILLPDETYTYSSWCPIQNTLGYMEGVYLMKDIDKNTSFDVVIPRFQLIVNSKLN